MAFPTETISYLQTQLDGLAGITLAPDELQERIPETPFAQTYLVSGSFGARAFSGPFATGNHVLVIQIFVSRQPLGESVKNAHTLLIPVVDMIRADLTLGDTVFDTESIEYIFDVLGEYGGETYLGYQITIGVIEK